MTNYIMKNDGSYRIEPDIIKWAGWLESADRIINKTFVGKSTVSTVFLGINHGTSDDPLLFETMVFGGSMDQEMNRYQTHKEALKGHDEMVKRVRDQHN